MKGAARTVVGSEFDAWQRVRARAEWLRARAEIAKARSLLADVRFCITAPSEIGAWSDSTNGLVMQLLVSAIAARDAARECRASAAAVLEACACVVCGETTPEPISPGCGECPDGCAGYRFCAMHACASVRDRLVHGELKRASIVIAPRSS